FWGQMVNAGAIHAPEELEGIAAKLSGIRTLGIGAWFPQRESIIDLLELVRTTTGKAHYAEVSWLINAALIWNATKNGREIPDLKFDRDSLKMIFKRHKLRLTASVRKLSH